MEEKDKAKKLAPYIVKNKKDEKHRAIMSVVVDGVRKKKSVGTFDTLAEAKSATEIAVDKHNAFLEGDIKETSVSLLSYVETEYTAWGRQNRKDFSPKEYIRFIKEFGYADMPLQKMTRVTCTRYRNDIAKFKDANGEPYEVLNNVYARLSAALNNTMKLGVNEGILLVNPNDRIPNPHKGTPRWTNEKERRYTSNRMVKTKTWSQEEIVMNLEKFATMSQTQLVKRKTRAAATQRVANVMKSDNAEAWKVYWTDNDGNYRSKNFNWKKLQGRERAKVLADKYADEVTKTLEQSDGTYISEVRTFVDIDSIMWWAYMSISLLLGLRNGEICALQFADFDETSKEVTINKQLAQRAAGVVEITRPKKDSYRTIPYGESIQAVLDSLRLYYAQNENNKDDYLLQYIAGGFIRPDYWSTYYRKAQSKAGIPENKQLLSTHKGRHTNLTNLSQYLSVSELMQVAGHSRYDTTHTFYIDGNQNKAKISAAQDRLLNQSGMSIESQDINS
jgi:integrase